MIQIYRPGNTEFEKNGDMTLFPESAEVHIVLNGEWEAEMEHPIDEEGRWKHITEEAVVKMPSFNGDQLFRIKKKEKTDGGCVVKMQPIFMDAKEDCFLTDVRPTNKSGQQALDIMTAANKKYRGKSDIKTVSTAYYQNQNLIEAINGDDENSFINRWGGEVLFDNFEVTVNERVGSDHGMEIRYGKNIRENGFSEEVDMRDVVTRLVPKAYNGHMIDGNEPWVDSKLIDQYQTVKYGVMTFEDVKMREDAKDDEEGAIVCDTQEQLNEALRKKCEEQYEKGLDKPKVTITVDIVTLEGTDLYREFEALEQMSIGDTVHCRHSKFDVTTDSRIIELTYNSILKRVESVKIGDFEYNYIDEVTSVINRVENAIRENGTVVGQQVQGIIDGVKAQLRAQSSVAEKQEVRAVLFEDLDPESQTFGAMCLGTMGFQIASERTTDGRDWKWTTFGTGQGFFADYIVAGTMLADRIKGGTLELGGKENGSGIVVVRDSAGKVIAQINSDGVYTKGDDGAVYMTGGNILIKNAKEETVGILAVNESDVWIQSYGGENNASVHLKKDGTVSITGSGGTITMQKGEGIEVIPKGNLLTSGKTTKTGRAEFSDGTYLEFKNGFLTGGNTSQGSF